MSETLFFELLQVALGRRERLSSTPTEREWTELFEMSQKQAVAGVAFEGVERLQPQIPRELLLQWFAISEQIKKRNILMNQRAVEVTRIFADAGFRSCILKGQGNNLLYPNPYVRNSGDIDIFAVLIERFSATERTINIASSNLSPVVIFPTSTSSINLLIELSINN